MNHTLRARVAIVAILVTGVMVRAGARQRASMPPEIARARVDSLFAAYSTGDPGIVERSLVTAADFQFTSALSTVFIQSARQYSRMRAAFLLEIAVAAFHQQEPGPMLAALNTGRFVVTNRDTAFGASAIDDRFEVLWHQTALALMDGMSQAVWRYDYLAAITPRIADASTRGVAPPNRFMLARAMTTAELCCPSRMRGIPIVIPVPPGQRSAPAERPDSIESEALAQFAAAAADASLAAEARVRGALLLQRLGRLDEAFAWMQKMPATDDVLVTYAGALVRGRTLDGLSRPDDAAASYDDASHAVPLAQVPAIGRAAALLRAGRTDDAIAAAERARRLPAMSGDPWDSFLLGDVRFVTVWLDEIRTLRR